MKKVLKYIFIITIILCLTIGNSVLAAYQRITIDEVKTYLENNVEEDDEVKTVSVDGSTVIIESTEGEVVKLFYEEENDIFYAEETFDNTMSVEYAKNRLASMAVLPYYGFLAVSEKNSVEQRVCSQYVIENGLMETTFGMLAIEIQPTVIEGIDSQINDEFINGVKRTTDYYDIEWNKIKTEDSITIRSSLIINTEADFSIMADKVQDKSIFITEENAEYSFTLKVGETYKIETTEEISGYSLKGDGDVDFSEDYTEITGMEPGIVYGYLFVGEQEKTIYITVTEGTENPSEDEDKTPSEEEPEPEDEEQKTEGDDGEDNTIIDNPELPQTGEKNFVSIIIICCIIGAILMSIKIRKYKTI